MTSALIWDVHIPITSYRIVPYYIVSWHSIRRVAHHTVIPYIISSNFILSHLIYRFRVVEQVREGECRTHQWSRRGRVLLIKTIAGEGNQLSYQEHYCDTMHYSTCSALLCCRVRASVGRPMSCLLLTVTVTGAQLSMTRPSCSCCAHCSLTNAIPDTIPCTALICSALNCTSRYHTSPHYRASSPLLCCSATWCLPRHIPSSSSPQISSLTASCQPSPPYSHTRTYISQLLFFT